MTNEQKLEANLAAAKLLGLNAVPNEIAGCWVETANGITGWEEFDIFTNTSECLATITTLLCDGVYITPEKEYGRTKFIVRGVKNNNHKLHNTLYEAVADAAVLCYQQTLNKDNV